MNLPARGGASIGSAPEPPAPGAHQPSGYRLLGRVVAKEPLGAMTQLTVEAPGWRRASPGQFALLQPEPSRCFLARALSVSDEMGERVSFVIAPIGEGTQELCALTLGEPVWVLGPLGKGFDVDALLSGPGRAILVGGGAGVAPFPLLLSRMATRSRGAGATSDTAPVPEVLVLLGFRDGVQAKAAVPVQRAALVMREAGLRCGLKVATEDGSRGPAAKVTDLLERHLKPGDRLAVCGPWAMSQGVRGVCSAVRDVEAWFSLETNMACGVGSCHGCVVTLADGSAARVCHDGPVFSGKEVFGG
ncbi:MAG: hypothetical protein A2133_11580 [Actinobacteria bacterium RBG_16_64_13]|nr:MAG: hypothetical protein A2133_11580 [Actinobacteria bacterium RBG_16_64_13]